MAEDEYIDVEVAYALPEQQLLIPVRVRRGATAGQAVAQSGILEAVSELDPGDMKLGIFGKHSTADRELRPGDRVEIYRELIADPKQVRRQRAAQGKQLKKGGGDADKPAD